MTRTVLLLSSLFVAACTVGQIPSAGDDGPGTADGGIDGANAAGCSDRLTPPGVAHPHTLGGGTNAGQDCMQAGACHLAGGGGPTFQFSGTIYKADATTPNPGAYIRILPNGGGAEVKLVSDDAGNFSMNLDAANPVALPAKTDVSACPKLTPMVGLLAAGATGGACNSCHQRNGGTTTPITLAD